MLHKQITVETEYYMDEHYTKRYIDTMLHVHSTAPTDCYTGTMLHRMLHKQITIETEYYVDEHYTERYIDTMLHRHSTAPTECYTGTMLLRQMTT